MQLSQVDEDMATKVLGVKIDNLSKEQALEKVDDFLISNGQKMIFTPNPEMLVDARKDDYFTSVLNSSSLNICDGIGVQLVEKEKIERIAGTDFMLEICKLAQAKGKSIYLLGGNDRTCSIVSEKLLIVFPELKIAGYSDGPKITKKEDNLIYYNNNNNDEVVADIVMAAPDILFVAFGHLKQEKWIYENLEHMPSVKIAMGVGGAFNFISGKIKRAPKWMQKLGLEWVYRLIQEPWRIKRILRAVFVFPTLVLLNKKSLK